MVADNMLSVALHSRRGDFSLHLDFQLEERSICALFGPSGSGKSTLINAIAGLITPDEGRIVCDGETWFDAARHINRPPEQRRLGYVFQDGRLFPHLSVKENLLFGRRFRKGEADFTLEDAAGLLGITHLLHRMPSTLSGGEQQRVAIGRALLCRPRLLLMDEPLTALDPARRGELMAYIAGLPSVWKVPVLYVTHSVEEVLYLASSVLHLKQGRLTAFGPARRVLRDAGVLPPSLSHLSTSGAFHENQLSA